MCAGEALSLIEFIPFITLYLGTSYTTKPARQSRFKISMQNLGQKFLINVLFLFRTKCFSRVSVTGSAWQDLSDGASPWQSLGQCGPISRLRV